MITCLDQCFVQTIFHELLLHLTRHSGRTRASNCLPFLFKVESLVCQSINPSSPTFLKWYYGLLLILVHASRSGSIDVFFNEKCVMHPFFDDFLAVGGILASTSYEVVMVIKQPLWRTANSLTWLKHDGARLVSGETHASVRVTQADRCSFHENRNLSQFCVLNPSVFAFNDLCGPSVGSLDWICAYVRCVGVVCWGLVDGVCYSSPGLNVHYCQKFRITWLKWFLWD